MKPTVRAAKGSDKKPLMDFIKNVWGGHDYLPQVWDEWLRDRNGKMYVVEVDGVPVGMNRVRFLEDGSAWFEGVRVHPEYRGRGLATMLGENSMRVASSRGVDVFRLTSNSRNRSAHRQVARMRFKEATRFSVYEPSKGMKLRPRDEVRLADEGDESQALRLARKSLEFELGTGVFWDGFTAASLSQKTLSSGIRKKSVYLTDDAVALARPSKEGKNRWNQVCFVGGDPAQATLLVEHIFATRERADWKLAYVPQGSPTIRALRGRGFKRSFSMVLFQRRAAKG